MAEQAQPTDLYLSSPDERQRRRPAILALVVVSLVIAGLVGFVAASRAPAASSATSAQAPESIVEQSRALPARPSVSLAALLTGAVHTVSPAPRVAPRVAAAVPREASPGFGCSFALAWLAGHAAPGFSFECPGYALGHQAMTCADVPGVCPGRRLIVISDPCPAAYMNEASNSWVVVGLRSGRLDPYGYCG